MTARFWFLAISFLVWALLGGTLWELLSTLEFGCKLQERDSGLWAECFAPAAIVFMAAFAVIFVVDLVQIVLAFRQMRKVESS